MPRVMDFFGSMSPQDSVEGDKPLTPDQLLLKNNIPAASQTPKSIEEKMSGMSERLLYITSANGEELDLKRVKMENGTVKLHLPPGVFPGRLGGSGERGCITESTDDTSLLTPFRPEWQDYIIHPRLTATKQDFDVRRTNGRRMKPHKIYHPENRTPFFPRGYPMHCVGRLLIWDNPASPVPQRSGSAVLVGSRVIVTSAHLMPRDGRPGRWGVRFVPAYFDGVSTVGLSSWCEAYRAATPPNVNDATQAFDIAVMKLYDPLGDILGWFGSRNYKSEWEDQGMWTLTGYAGDIANAERPSLQIGISVIDDDPDGKFSEIEHRGDASSGNSGGPLFGTFPDGPYVIGIHSGSEYRTIDIPLIPTIIAEDNNVAAGGVGMVEMIRTAQADWP